MPVRLAIPVNKTNKQKRQTKHQQPAIDPPPGRVFIKLRFSKQTYEELTNEKVRSPPTERNKFQKTYNALTPNLLNGNSWPLSGM